MFDLNSSKPIIVYPTQWTFAVIGTDEIPLRLSIAEVMKGLAYDIKPSKQSSTKKYSSFHVVVTVDSEEHRNNLYQALAQQPGVRKVI